MGKHTEKAIRLLWGKYAALGSWAAVAEDIGLQASDRAAVRKAAHGAIMVKVYRALRIPYKKEAQERARLSRIRGAVPLSGRLHYTDKDGRPAVADLSQRAQRLGMRAKEIQARSLYKFIIGRAVPALREKVKNG